MSGTLLNSGNISEHIPIGEDGKPVWTLADAFRQAIALAPALGKKYADILAIPRFTLGGKTVNWYIPFSPSSPQGHKVVLWSAASELEKEMALNQLKDFGERLRAFGDDLQRHPANEDDKIFAHFLTGSGVTEELPAIHFPDENCVYIVDNKPVITFWGFMNKDGDLKVSPFKNLDLAKQISSNTADIKTATVAVATMPWWRKHLLCLLWPLFLLLALLLAYLLWWWLFGRASGLSPFKTLPDLTHGSLDPIPYEKVLDPKKVIEEDPAELVVSSQGVSQGENALVMDPALADEHDAIATNLDGSKADDSSSVGQESSTQEDNEQNSAQDLDNKDPNAQDLTSAQSANDQVPQDQTSLHPKDDAHAQTGSDKEPNLTPQGDAQTPLDPATDENGSIKLDPVALKQGSVKELDGNWKTSSGLVDSKTGKSVSVAYKFKNGAGQAEITRTDGVKCNTATKGSADGTSLSISGGLAHCTDGGSVKLPQVKCTPDPNGKTNCVGVYGKGAEDVPMDLYR